MAPMHLAAAEAGGSKQQVDFCSREGSGAGAAQRATVPTKIRLAAREGLAFEERAFSREEAYRAREAFFSSATTIAMPVVAIDGRPIGGGLPGPLTLALRRKFHTAAQRG